MKKFYNQILNTLQGSITKLEILKMYLAENYALLRKKKVYKDINWSESQISEFNNYWRKHYGKKINPNGHKLYEAINGVHHKDYFPDFLYATKLEPRLNNYSYAKLYSDKSLTELLYAKSVNAKFPKTYLINNNGVYYNGERKVINSIEAESIFTNLQEYVMKPTIGGNSGKGVYISNKNSKELFDRQAENYIVQEKMKQHESISKIYDKSVNTIRAITYNLNGNTYCANMTLRIGSGGSTIDNIHAGGLSIGVTTEGELHKFAYKLGYSNLSEKYTHHPNTNVEFHRYKIEQISKIPEAAIELHGLTPNIGMVSWDFMIDKKGDLVIIEANYWGQSIWFTQILHGQPFFGKQTEQMIKLIKK